MIPQDTSLLRRCRCSNQKRICISEVCIVSNVGAGPGLAPISQITGTSGPGAGPGKGTFALHWDLDDNYNLVTPEPNTVHHVHDA